MTFKDAAEALRFILGRDCTIVDNEVRIPFANHAEAIRTLHLARKTIFVMVYEAGDAKGER